MSANLVLPKIHQLHPLVQHPHQRKEDSTSLAVRGTSSEREKRFAVLCLPYMLCAPSFVPGSSSRPNSTPASSVVLPPGLSPSPLSTREKKERTMKLVLDEVMGTWK